MRNFLFAAGLLSFFVACEDDTGSAPVDYTATLRSLTEGVILPANAAFATHADELATAAAALESAPDAGTLANVQKAWRAARADFRMLDAAHFGPVATLGISERIDLTPAKPGDIDALVGGTAAIDAQTVAVAGGKSKGFLGMEYLVFASGGDAAALANLQGQGTAARRRTLVRLMAAEIATSAHQLADAWAIGKGGYAGEVENAGTTSKRYPSQRAAIDDIVGGAAYALELVVGLRLASPLGRNSGGTPDPSLDPTRTSDSAVADMTATLAGVRAFYEEGGLSARVRSKTSALDAAANSELGGCTAKVSAIPSPFATSVTASTATVEDAYAACKALKATWNTDVTRTLGATVKPGDVDGD